MKTIAIAYVSILTVMSLVTFLAYGWDKRQSKIGGWRIPESRLHWLAFLGGWPGAMMGQKLLRHKTQKWIFQLSLWSAALLHLFGVAAIIYLWLNRQ